MANPDIDHLRNRVLLIVSELEGLSYWEARIVSDPDMRARIEAEQTKLRADLKALLDLVPDPETAKP